MRACLLIALVLATLAHASGDDLTNISKNENTLSGGDLVGGDAVGGDTTTIALSPANLGDVDISGCLASTQYSVFILWARQNIEIDPLCVADEYDMAGKHNLAAQLRCGVPLIRDLDYTGSTCIIENTFDLAPAPAAPDPFATVNLDDAHAPVEDHDEYERKLDEITKRLDNEAAQRRSNVRRYEREQAEQKQADEDFYGGYLEKFEQMQQQEPPDNE